jgi:hypothetical protein
MPNDIRHHFSTPQTTLVDALGLGQSEYATFKESVLRAAATAAYLGADTSVMTYATEPSEAPQTGVQSGTTASTARPPSPAKGISGSALDLSDSDWAAARAAAIGGR